MADLNQGVAKSTSTSASAFSLTSAFFEPSHGSDGPSDLSASNTKAENQEAKRSETVSELDLQDHSSANEEEDIALPASRFSDRLDTNYIPSASEISEINKYVTIVDSKIALCDAQIARLTTALQDLTAKRTTLHDTRAAHCALASPVRRLPPEILQTIFAWCLPSPRDCFMHASEAPVLLGHVCSEWRRIAHATPVLWATLHVVVQRGSLVAYAASQASRQDLVRTWLARAGACPLHIHVSWLGADSEEGLEHCRGLLELLEPLAARLRVLHFHLPLKLFRSFVNLGAADVPLLEELILTDSRMPTVVPDSLERWPQGLNFVHNARGLRTLRLHFFNGWIQLPAICWSQLTTLHLEANVSFFFADGGAMRATLALCTSLVRLTLSLPLSSYSTAALPAHEQTDATVVLPRLEELYVDSDSRLAGPFNVAKVLASICAPRLRLLHLKGRGVQYTRVEAHELAAVCTLLRKSHFPPLETLMIFAITADADELVKCLRMVPTLWELIIYHMTWHRAEATEGNQLLLALTISRPSAQEENGQEDADPARRPDNVILNEGSIEDDEVAPEGTNSSFMCPNLRYIVFVPSNASQQIFYDFVASRWENPPPGVARIQKVEANFMSYQEEEVKVRIARFMQEGLYAYFRYGP